MRDGEARDDLAAVRVRQERRAPKSDRAGEAVEGLAELVESERPPRPGAEAEPGQVGHDDSEAASERTRDRQEVSPRDAEPVDQHERRSVAGFPPVDGPTADPPPRFSQSRVRSTARRASRSYGLLR